MQRRHGGIHKDLFAWLCFLVAAVIFAAAGLNGLFGLPNEQWWRIPVRIAVLGVSVALFVLAVVLWSRWHSDTLGSDRTGHSDLHALHGKALTRFLSKRVTELGLTRPEKTGALAKALRGEATARSRVQEQQRVDGNLVHWRVTLHLREEAVLDLGLARDVVLLTRRDRGDGYGRTEGLWGDGSPVSLLTLAEAAGITWYVMCRAVDALPHELHPDLHALFARCVASEGADTTGPHERSLISEAQEVLREVPAPDKEPVLRLVEAVAARRPIYAWAPGAAETVTFTYVSSLSTEAPKTRDWWRSFKDRVRRRVHLPPSLFTLNMERASSAESYSLEVLVPEGLYIDESEFFDEQLGTLEETPKNSISAVFLGKSARNGREDIRVFAWNVAEARPPVRPQLLVRVLERPPGSLTGAWLVALAVTTTTWLTGVVTAVSLRQQHRAEFLAAIHRVSQLLPFAGHPLEGDLDVTTQPFSTGIDLAALAVVLPGLLAAWLGVAFTRARGDYRSITGLVSLAISAALALTSIVAYVGRFAVGRIAGMDFAAPRTWFFLADGLSALLLLTAILNFFTVGGLAYARLRRYRKLRETGRGLT